MKDFLGKELSVGDQVVFPEPKYRNLKTGTIVRFTPQKAVIEYYWSGAKGVTTYTIDPTLNVIKV